MGKDSIGKIIGVSLAVCIVCSVLVSATAVVLKPIQDANKALDKKTNILLAAGLIEEGQKVARAEVDSLYETKIEGIVIDLSTGQVVEGEKPAELDWQKNAKLSDTSKALDPKEDLARIKRQSNQMPVYLYKEGDQVKRVVLPVYGKGLWSTMYGFLSLDGDLRTIGALTFYDHGETPGLGGEIVNPKWKAKWEGKLAYDENWTPEIHVIKGSVNPESASSEYQVDGLSGATLTCNGVTNLLQFWLGEDGYEPYLKNLHEEKN